MRQYLCCMSPWDFEYNAYQPAGCNFNAPLGLMQQKYIAVENIELIQTVDALKSFKFTTNFIWPSMTPFIEFLDMIDTPCCCSLESQC